MRDRGMQGERISTAGYTAPSGPRLDRALARTSDAPLREGSRLELLKNGPNTYGDWLTAIARARRWVHLDNYIFEGTTGKRFAAALSAKAAEGVKVRVLHDWSGCVDVPRSFWQELRGSRRRDQGGQPPDLGCAARGNPT